MLACCVCAGLLCVGALVCCDTAKQPTHKQTSTHRCTQTANPHTTANQDNQRTQHTQKPAHTANQQTQQTSTHSKPADTTNQHTQKTSAQRQQTNTYPAYQHTHSHTANLHTPHQQVCSKPAERHKPGRTHSKPCTHRTCTHNKPEHRLHTSTWCALLCVLGCGVCWFAGCVLVCCVLVCSVCWSAVRAHLLSVVICCVCWFTVCVLLCCAQCVCCVWAGFLCVVGGYVCSFARVCVFAVDASCVGLLCVSWFAMCDGVLRVYVWRCVVCMCALVCWICCF